MHALQWYSEAATDVINFALVFPINLLAASLSSNGFGYFTWSVNGVSNGGSSSLIFFIFKGLAGGSLELLIQKIGSQIWKPSLATHRYLNTPYKYVVQYQH